MSKFTARSEPLCTLTVLRRSRLLISDELFESVEISHPANRVERTTQEHERRWSTGQITNNDDHSNDHDQKSCVPKSQDKWCTIGRQVQAHLDAGRVEHAVRARVPPRSTRSDCVVTVASRPLDCEPQMPTSPRPRANFQSSNRSSTVSPGNESFTTRTAKCESQEGESHL